MNDHPFNEVAAEAEALGESGSHHLSEIHLRSLWVAPDDGRAEPVLMFGQCEACGAETDLRARGCNYMLMASIATAH